MIFSPTFQVLLAAFLSACCCARAASTEFGTNAISALALAGAFRSAATVDISTAVKTFSSHPDPAGLLSAPLRRTLPDCWGPFFAGTFVLGSEFRGSNLVFAFYNPFLDVALFTTWHSKSKSQIRDAWWTFAPWIEPTGADTNHLADPTVLPDPLRAAERLGRFETNFLKAFPSGTSDEVSGPSADYRAAQEVSVQRRVFVAQMAFASFERLDDSSQTTPWRDWTAALKATDRKQLSELIKEGMTVTQEALWTMPQETRKGIETLHAIQSDDRLLTFAWNPQIPVLVVIADYVNTNGWRLQNAALMLMRK